MAPEPWQIPAAPRRLSRDDLRRVYEATRTIAVVGASARDGRAANYVPAYLQSQGYRIIPVNPRGGELFGEAVHVTLDDLTEPVDVVDVFRRPEEGPEIVRAAARIGARLVWFQPGTESAEATAAAAEAGLAVVTRLCMGVTHATLGLGPGPDHADEG
jgi:predicted CoA-binding protein